MPFAKVASSVPMLATLMLQVYALGNASLPLTLSVFVAVRLGAVMLMALLSGAVSEPLAACNLWAVPTVSIALPPVVATPEVVANGFTVQVNVPGPPDVGVPVVMVNVIEAELLVTVLPLESWTVTTDCSANAVPRGMPKNQGEICNRRSPAFGGGFARQRERIWNIWVFYRS